MARGPDGGAGDPEGIGLDPRVTRLCRASTSRADLGGLELAGSVDAIEHPCAISRTLCTQLESLLRGRTPRLER